MDDMSTCSRRISKTFIKMKESCKVDTNLDAAFAFPMQSGKVCVI